MTPKYLSARKTVSLMKKPFFLLTVFFFSLNSWCYDLIDAFDSTPSGLVQGVNSGETVSGSMMISSPEVGIAGEERDYIYQNTGPMFIDAQIAWECTEQSCGFRKVDEAIIAAPFGSGNLQLHYDGSDGNGSTLDFLGLNNSDLTNDGTNNSFRLHVNAPISSGELKVTVYTDENNYSYYSINSPPGGSYGTDVVVVFPFSEFQVGAGDGADFTKVGALEFYLAIEGNWGSFDEIGVGSYIETNLTSEFAVGGDINGDGDYDPGDTIKYTVIITNPDDDYNLPAKDVIYDASIGGRGQLQGSISNTFASQGTFVEGDAAEDENISLNLGDIPDGGSATITYIALFGEAPVDPGEIYSHFGIVKADSNLTTLNTNTDSIDLGVFDLNFEISGPDPADLDDPGDADGFWGPGEIATFTALITNVGELTVPDLHFLLDEIDGASLVAGSVETAPVLSGTDGDEIVWGNSLNDSRIIVDIEDLTKDESISVSFDLMIDSDFAFTDASYLLVQGGVLKSDANPFGFYSAFDFSILSDDPNSGIEGDPTSLLVDAFVNNRDASKDLDGDGYPDEWNASPVLCDADCQNSSLLSLDENLDDFDNDGITDGVDTDDDNDLYSDSSEELAGSNPKDPSSLPPDYDEDFEADVVDADDDNDGYSDEEEGLVGTDPKNDMDIPPDFDQDFEADVVDDDDDNDGVNDTDDVFPFNSNESLDTDLDGIGNNADVDDDNDGVDDVLDAFPYDEKESVDTDGDGLGNNADTDDDGDGSADIEDAFPLDTEEQNDTDGDGTGDNADIDDDNDGVNDAADAFPNDAIETTDNDGDGIGDVADTDDDNDGVTDAEDAFPTVAAASVDTDGDGLPDAFHENCDAACLEASTLTVDPVPTSTNNIISSGGGGGSFGNVFLTMLFLIGIRRKFI